MPDEGQFYVLMAMNLTQTVKTNELDQVLDQLCCPNTKPGSFSNRPSACNIGAKVYCDAPSE